MSYQPSRMLTPVDSRKRKEREFPYSYNNSPPGTTRPKPSLAAAAAAKLKGAEPAYDNRLLAGYMAYEFLTKGTMFGQQFNPGRAGIEPNRVLPQAEPIGVKDHEGYGDVACILKTDGTHIPGIVNPTQLARWIQM